MQGVDNELSGRLYAVCRRAELHDRSENYNPHFSQTLLLVY